MLGVEVFEALLDSAPDALIVVDSDGRMVLVNAQTEAIFGYGREELIGQRVEILVPESVRPLHSNHRHGYMAAPWRRPMGAGVDLTGRRKDGSEFPVEISLSALDTEAGRIVSAAVRDATGRLEAEAERDRLRADAEAERLEARMHESQRLEGLGLLAGGVAHDFNNLLGVILNYNTLLTRRITDPVAVADLGEVRAAAERGAVLIRQLLTFASRDLADPEALDVAEVVVGVASMLERTLGENIELRIQLAAVPLVALADRHQLEQVLLNLAINARDAMPEGGVLTIIAAASMPETSTGVGEVVLEVADTGEGMAAEVVLRAFEPFFTTKPPGRGTGLGLATVYGIVKQSGGHVTIASTVGVGTVVTVRLPATDVIVSPVGDPAARIVGGHERILLVEDEAALRVGAARLLQEHGYEVLVASDGAEALAVFDREEGRFDLVLTDVVMPRMRGDQLARLLAEQNVEVPVMFMTGYDSGEALPTGRVLAKPVAGDVLLRSIRQVLDV